MALDGKSILPMNYVTLGTKMHHITWIPYHFRQCIAWSLFPSWIIRIPPNTRTFWKLIEYWYFFIFYEELGYLQELQTKRKKSAHTLLFINYKNPCRFWHTVSIFVYCVKTKKEVRIWNVCQDTNHSHKEYQRGHVDL